MACPARKPSSEPLCINFSQKLIIYMCFLLFIVATIRPSRPAPPAPAAGRSGSPRPQQPNAVTPRPQQPNGASPGLPQQSPAGPSPGPGQGEIACCHSRCCFLCCSVALISVLLSVISNISVAWNAGYNHNPSVRGQLFQKPGLHNVHLDAANRFSLSIVSCQVWLEKSG